MSPLPLTRAREPLHIAWSRDRLDRERAITLGHAVEASTLLTYNSHLQSYLNFCKLHAFPIEPTPDTLSYYIVYMAHQIKPASVAAYLSGICNTLQPHFPDVRSSRNSPLVTKALAGMRKVRGLPPTQRKRPLSSEDLSTLLSNFKPTNYDNVLFCTMLLTGFAALLRLGEMTQPDNPHKRSNRKSTLRHSLILSEHQFSFHLPFHKADRLYQGNMVVVLRKPDPESDPLAYMRAYLSQRDNLFPYHPELWLTSSRSIPTYSWFVAKLRSTLGPNVGGHSIRSGAATALALAGVPDNVIQAMGRWASEAFKIYIRKHPIVLHALIHGRSATDVPN